VATTTRIDVDARAGSAAEVRVQGVLDIVSAPELGAALARAMRGGECRVVVDCGLLTSIDVDGLRVLRNARGTLGRARRLLVLRSVPESLVPAFAAAGLAGLIE
jgi:anti-anti-sigma factor